MKPREPNKLDLAHEELLQKWRRSSTEDDPSEFISDGPINYECWKKGPRILFILKESYREAENKLNWSCIPASVMKELRSDGKPYSPAYRQLMKWAEWLYPLGGPAKSLEAAAIVNAKKWNTNKGTARKSRAQPVEIWKYAIRDHCFLRQQIAVLDPRLVVVAGAWEPLCRTTIFEGRKKVHTNLNYGQGLFEREGQYILAYRHPQGCKHDRVKSDFAKVSAKVWNLRP